MLVFVQSFDLPILPHLSNDHFVQICLDIAIKIDVALQLVEELAADRVFID